VKMGGDDSDHPPRRRGGEGEKQSVKRAAKEEQYEVGQRVVGRRVKKTKKRTLASLLAGHTNKKKNVSEGR